ncbi:AAA family ATPase [Euzebya sp.]|uniref:SF1B family DNA helicase RecD2 n=1 Tax=Euzebya sp. TaxID=1971409 RepID=UPI0035189FE2
MARPSSTTPETLFGAEAPERVAGEVVYVIYADEGTGFAVVSVDEDREGAIRAAGPLAGLAVGQAVTLVGRWNDHPKHGRTFDADFYELATPRTKSGLQAFLASDRFPGVGEKLAAKLVKAFGTGLDQVIANEPERLTQVTGVSAALAARIHGAWQSAGMLPRIVQVLASVDLGPAVARAAVKRFGDEAAEVLADDPYAYLSLPGVRWRHADALGRAAGIDDDDPRRLAAGAAGLVQALCWRDGHTWVGVDEVRRRLPSVLGGGADRADRALAAAVEVGELDVDDEPIEGPPDGGGPDPLPGGRVAPRLIHEAELTFAAHVADLVGGDGGRANPAAADAEVPDGPGEGLTAEQARAVATALTHPVSVLTGGPGTGKTHAITELIRRAAAAGAEIALCAPTGRAAKRLEEVTGHAATTVHRLLEARPDPSEGFTFGRTIDNPLPHDLVVADEWSMADVHLAAALLEALEPPTHLLLVGDPDQLPPVGPGASLRNLLASRAVPVTRLTEVHRQAAESRIVTLAHELNAGASPVVTGRDGDVFAVPERTPGIAARVAAIVAERAPAFFDCAPADVQVLASMYRGPAGVDAINAALKDRLNPAADRPAVGGWHEGDRVVATRNDPESDVANGDIGEVAATDRTAGSVTVAFPQGEVTLDGERLGQLAPAWCLTVHKSQGGEWPVVVLVLDRAHRSMLTRELVYTALTRARRGLLLVGDPRLVTEASTRVGAGLTARRTTLAARLARDIAYLAPTGEDVADPSSPDDPDR